MLGRGSDNVTRLANGFTVSVISAAILVGGRARRLDGQFKPALRVGNQTILERQLTALHAAGIRDVILVGEWRGDRVPGVRHLPDVVDDRSALGGLYSAMLLATTPAIIVLAGDLPFVEAELLEKLAELGEHDDAVVPRTADGWHPLCAGYRRRVACRIKQRLDRGAFRVTDAIADMKVRELTATALAPLDQDGFLLMNVNTPFFYARARRGARRRS